jgi:hypothetical protein
MACRPFLSTTATFSQSSLIESAKDTGHYQTTTDISGFTDGQSLALAISLVMCVISQLLHHKRKESPMYLNEWQWHCRTWYHEKTLIA